ncbi:MAG: hypothetical protein AB1390_01030 [Nitrospirota bacterium]
MMKKKIALLALMTIFALATFSYAQWPGMMGGQGWYCPYCGQPMGPGMWGGGMMGPGMMGGGMGMMGHGMMGRGMMGGGMMGPGMMGPGMMAPEYSRSEACQKVLDETAGLRKDLHSKRFEYFETLRNPKATPESLAKLEKEIQELQQSIYSKTPQGCWWQ